MVLANAEALLQPPLEISAIATQRDQDALVVRGFKSMSVVLEIYKNTLTAGTNTLVIDGNGDTESSPFPPPAGTPSGGWFQYTSPTFSITAGATGTFIQTFTGLPALVRWRFNNYTTGSIAFSLKAFLFAS